MWILFIRKMHDFNIHTISKYRQGDKEAPPFFCLNLEIKNSNSFLKKENNFKIIFNFFCDPPIKWSLYVQDTQRRDQNQLQQRWECWDIMWQITLRNWANHRFVPPYIHVHRDNPIQWIVFCYIFYYKKQ